MPILRLRNTEPTDLNFVLSAEADAENRPYIMTWSRQEHCQALERPNVAHLTIERVMEQSPAAPVGYLILVGLQDPNHSIQLRRIVVTDKGKGFGKQAIAQVKRLAFEVYQAHRLWLDVKPFNRHARNLYKSAGFVEEGMLRECFKSEDGYGSLIIMSILRSEYDAARG